MRRVVVYAFVLMFCSCAASPGWVTRALRSDRRPTLAATVQVRGQDATGSGVAVAADTVVTARHVAQGHGALTVRTADGAEYEVVECLVSPGHDVATLRIGQPVLTPCVVGSVADVAVGQQVLCVGSPLGEINFNHVSDGIVSGLDRDWYGRTGLPGWQHLFTVTAAAGPGSSGGPVFTREGRLIGVVVGTPSVAVGCIVGCVPIDYAP